MPHNRFFLDEPLQKDRKISLQDEEARHLKVVMRNQIGDTVEIVNGKGKLATCTIKSFDKTAVTLEINDLSKESPSLPLILCMAIPRLNRLDTIVEKGTELGMTELWLFPGSLSEKKTLSDTQYKRLETISIAALKQSGRLHLPRISFKPSLFEWKDLPYTAYFGDLDPFAPPLLTVLKKEQEGICFFIGPEAGFTQEEEEFLREKLKAQGVKLNSKILRTDTAALIAVGIISAYKQSCLASQ